MLALSEGACATCGSKDGVQAHHLAALADGGDPEGEGVALCKRHHEQATRAEKRARARAASGF